MENTIQDNRDSLLIAMALLDAHTYWENEFVSAVTETYRQTCREKADDYRRLYAAAIIDF